MPAATTPQDNQRPARTPAISEEADKVLWRILIRYTAIAAVVALVTMVLCGVISAQFPRSALFGPKSPLYSVTSLLFFIPFLIGQNKQASARMEFARRYAAEQRWSEAAAALAQFDTFGQRSFDHAGEAHYLLAQAYDRLGKKAEAAKMRAWVLKHRAGTPWAQKIMPAAASQPQHLRRKVAVRPADAEATGVDAATTAHRKPMPGRQARSRRRRF